MAGHKETPRQKMIGMMYLVLTALLALNVSADILNAFTIVNEGMVRTNNNFEAKNNQQYADFETQYQLNKAKVGPFYKKAKQAKVLSNKLISQIKEVQNKIIGFAELGDANIRNFPFEFENNDGETVDTTISEPRDLKLEWIEAKSDYDKPGNILLGKEDGTGGEASLLKAAFADYKDNILKLLSKEQADGIKLGLNTESHYNTHAGKKQNWEMNTFYHTVLSADVVLLNKYIAEVMNIESEVISILYSNIKADDLGFSKVVAAVIPSANIVLAGEDYEAKIFVAAYSDTDTPIVMLKGELDTLYKKDYAGATTIDSISNGVKFYRVKTSATGDYKYAGVIKVKKPDGGYLIRHFHSSYSVIKPSAAIAADAMNVVYRGLDNPMTISAAGFTNDQIRLVASGGAGHLTSKGNGHYIFKPSLSKAKEVTFSVIATKPDGTTQKLAPTKFRIKNLPSPSISLAGKKEGNISKSVLINSPFLSARLIDFLFKGVKYKVLSYTLTLSGRGVGSIQKKVTGTRIPPKYLKKLKNASTGTLVNVSAVKVIGPDGKKSAQGLTLRIK